MMDAATTILSRRRPPESDSPSARIPRYAEAEPVEPARHISPATGTTTTTAIGKKPNTRSLDTRPLELRAKTWLATCPRRRGSPCPSLVTG